MRRPALGGMARHTLQPGINFCHLSPQSLREGEKACHLLSIELSSQNQEELGMETVLEKVWSGSHVLRLV